MKFIIFSIILSLIASFLIPIYEVVLVCLTVISLLLFNRFYVRYIKKHFAIERYIQTKKIFNGDSTQAGVYVENKGILPILLIHIADYTSMELSLRQKVSFFTFLPPKSKKLLKYPIYGTKRGDHYLGPTIVEFHDFLGLEKESIEYTNTVDFVTVFPSILIHKDIDKSTLQPYGEIKNKLPIFEDISKIQGVREYEPGDEVRRINWKISAKHGKLYVNYYTHTVSSGSLVVLNLDKRDFDMKFSDYFSEFSIETCATIVRELYSYHQNIAFVCNGEVKRKQNLQGKQIIENPSGFLEIPMGKGENHTISIFEILARVYTQEKISLLDSLKNLSIKIPWGSALIIITPKLQDETLHLLSQYRMKGLEVFIFNTYYTRAIQDYKHIGIHSYNIFKEEKVLNIY